LEDLRIRLADNLRSAPPVPGQVLVHTPMPCAGLGECGVCSIQVRVTPQPRRTWKLVCRDGPVFNLADLI
jgi:hypothetical protein